MGIELERQVMLEMESSNPMPGQKGTAPDRRLLSRSTEAFFDILSPLPMEHTYYPHCGFLSSCYNVQMAWPFKPDGTIMQQLAVTFDLNNDTICRRSCYGSLLWVESSMGWGCGREPDTLLTASWCLLNLKINQQSECGGWNIWLILIAYSRCFRPRLLAPWIPDWSTRP